MIRVIVCHVGEPPEVRDIDESFKAMKAIVSGYIELVRITADDITLVCDEEGVVKGKPFNRRVPCRGLVGRSQDICGAFFVCRRLRHVGLDGDELVGLSEADIAEYLPLLALPAREARR